jgi:hypothetical protein
MRICENRMGGGGYVKKFGNHWSVSEQKLCVFKFGYHENCAVSCIFVYTNLTETLPGPMFFLCIVECLMTTQSFI